MFLHSRGTAERFFSSHFSLCNTQLISLRLQQWKEIMRLRDGRGCYVHMSCELSREEARRLGAFGSLHTVIQPRVPLCLRSLCARMGQLGCGMSVPLSALSPRALSPSVPWGGKDADSIAWDLRRITAAPRGNQSSPKVRPNQP